MTNATRTTEALTALYKYHRDNIRTLSMIAESYWSRGETSPDRIEDELASERQAFNAIMQELRERQEWQPAEHGKDQHEDRTMQSTRKRLNAKMTMTVAVTYLTMGNHSTMVPVSFTDWLIQGYQRGLALN